MEKIKVYMNRAALVALMYTIMLGFAGCKDEPLVLGTTSDVNITGYFEKNADQFSEFMKVLNASENAGFLGAYGAYTVFAPTNEGIAAYLKEQGKSKVEDLSIEELKNIVKFHVLLDTIYTTSFTDGKLPKLTMLGQYLITGASNVNGQTSITINRQANVVKGNIVVGNGIIHAIDHVLTPAKQTVAEMIHNNPNYSIFDTALVETGWSAKLNSLPSDQQKWLTVLAESNQALIDSGITSYQALKRKYSNLSPTNAADSLNLYVAYHILEDAKYLSDIVSASSHATLAPLEVVTTKLEGETVLVNDDVFNEKHEPGIVLDRNLSDNSATNGVVHTAKAHFNIKVRKPQPEYWDLADQPEFRKLVGIFRNGKTQSINPFAGDKPLENITWQQGAIIYQGNAGNGHFFGDRLELPMGVQSARNQWVKFKTPLLVKGTYKVWVCYRRGGTATCQPYFDGEPMSRTVNFGDYIPSGTEAEREAAGWKLYADVSSNNQGRYLGTVNIKTTDRHIIEFKAIAGGVAQGIWWDMIHFIPVDMDQLYPRFKADGSRLNRP